MCIAAIPGIALQQHAVPSKVRDGEAALLALLAELEKAEDQAHERRAAAASEAAKVEAATAAARKAQCIQPPQRTTNCQKSAVERGTKSAL